MECNLQRHIFICCASLGLSSHTCLVVGFLMGLSISVYESGSEKVSDKCLLSYKKINLIKLIPCNWKAEQIMFNQFMSPSNHPQCTTLVD